MKRLVCGILSLLIILSLTGCGSSGIKGRDDVSGKRIGVLAGTSSVRYGEMHGEVTEYLSLIHISPRPITILSNISPRELNVR